MMFMQMDSPKLNSPKHNAITHLRSSISLQLSFCEYGAEKSLMYDQTLIPYNYMVTNSRDKNSILQERC